MRKLYVCAALGALVLAAVPASAAIIIDDFETGVSFVLSGGNREDAATSAIGGARFLAAGSVVSATLSLTPGDDALQLSSPLGTLSCCFMQLVYDGSLDGNPFGASYGPIDLSEGGLNDVLRLSFSDVSADSQVRLVLKRFNATPSAVIKTALAGSATLDFALSDFAPLDVSSNGAIEIQFQSGGPLSLTQIAAVPEPSTGLLLALGLGGLAWRRRRA